MPFPDYSGNGGGERFEGPVESTIKQRAGTGTPLTSQNLQEIGRTIDDEIDKVKSSASSPAPKQVRTPGEVTLVGADTYLNELLDNTLVINHYVGDVYNNTQALIDGYKSGNGYALGFDLAMVSREGTKDAEVIIVATGPSYARNTGVNRYGWVGVPHGDDFVKWASGVNALDLQPKQGQVTGDGNTLAITMYNKSTSSGTFGSDPSGLYQIYFHGFYTGSPRYDDDAKVWTGRVFHIDEAMLVYTNPTTGKQYVTQIKN